MDGVLLRSLPVSDPDSLVVLKWRSRPVNWGARAGATDSEFVLHSINGSTYNGPGGLTAGIFPFPAFELLQQASPEQLSSLFAYHPAGNLNVMVKGQAEQAKGQYVSGDFFRGLAVSPAAGRLILGDDDRVGAPPVAVVSEGYSRRFGGPGGAAGQPILVNNLPFTVIGVAPPGFFGVDPGSLPDVYLPLRAQQLLDPNVALAYPDPNYYWVEMMGRLRPAVSRAQAQAALTATFAGWVAGTAKNDGERANLPVLWLEEGAGGLDSLRRKYSKPLYVLLAMVGLILAMACANAANLLLARASARRREMAVRLSIGAGRFRLVRQLLTETVLLASLSGVLGILIAVAGMRVLTVLLANGQEGFTLHAELNWRVLGVTLGLSLLCGVVFGLAPALQSTSPALMPALKDRSVSQAAARQRGRSPLSLIQGLVVAQVAISLLLLVAAGLFVRTLAKLHSIPLGFDRAGLLLFDMHAPHAGYPPEKAVAFYADLRRRLAEIPGVRNVTLSHASLIRAGRGHPILVDGVPTRGTRLLHTGPAFFTTMQIPILRGREFSEGDRQATAPVAVVSELFAKTFLGDKDPIGLRIVLRAGRSAPVDLEIVGVAATARYGRLKAEIPPVVYLPYAQQLATPVQGMTFALRSDGDPLRHAAAVRRIAQEADARVPVTNLKSQAAEIDQSINQEIVFARLCSAFAGLALLIACVGLYATMAYGVARRTNEIGIRMALGARRGSVVWMVLGEVCLLAALGLAISLPVAVTSSRLLQAFLFELQPNDPRALAAAVAILWAAALLAGYAPARRASRVDPMTALRNE